MSKPHPAVLVAGILALVLCHPLGWIGMICLALVVSSFGGCGRWPG